MSPELYLAYVAATFILLAIPGPTILLVVSYALAGGRRTGWSTVPGVALGDFTAMVLSFAGMGAVLAASAAAFTVLKWIGAAYLVWLGLKLWRAPVLLPAAASPSTVVSSAAPATRQRLGRGMFSQSMFAHAWLVTALNPKGIVFFVAFVPQFLTPGAPVLPQLGLLGGTFLALAILNAGAYALLAGTARQAITRPSLLRAVNRVGGSLLIGAGIATAALRRAA